MIYNKETNTYTLHSFSDLLSNFPHKDVKLSKVKHIIKDKNNLVPTIYYAFQELDFPITIEILENG